MFRRFRNSATGRYVDPAFAAANPAGTVAEQDRVYQVGDHLLIHVGTEIGRYQIEGVVDGLANVIRVA